MEGCLASKKRDRKKSGMEENQKANPRTDLKVKLSPKVKGIAADGAVREFLWRFEGVSISPPRRFVPDTNFLRYHNEQVFLSP